LFVTLPRVKARYINHPARFSARSALPVDAVAENHQKTTLDQVLELR
jgi:hypothetical protein